MKTLLRILFHLLYHQFAFTYDLVAATVSLNRWKDWVLSVLPFLEGKRILEIGHGPGHLQHTLLSRGFVAVGLDESVQMGRLARRNLAKRHSSLPGNLARGLAQHLPFPAGTFDTVVATFPAEYIFAAQTLNEAQRVLAPGGRFVILPGALITGRGTVDRVLAWLFRITGETPADLSDLIRERAGKPFAQAGFHVETQEVSVKSSLVFIMIATKSLTTEQTNHA